MKKTILLIISLSILSAAALAADQPPAKLWDYTCPFNIAAYYSVVDSRGGIAVGDADLAQQILWFDSKGKPISISITNGSAYLLYCSPTILVLSVSTDGGKTSLLRRYKRNGTYTQTSEPFGLIIRTARVSDDLGAFVVSTDGTKLTRYRY